eukprot:1026139-Amphidinium_carterae.5
MFGKHDLAEVERLHTGIVEAAKARGPPSPADVLKTAEQPPLEYLPTEPRRKVSRNRQCLQRTLPPHLVIVF